MQRVELLFDMRPCALLYGLESLRQDSDGWEHRGGKVRRVELVSSLNVLGQRTITLNCSSEPGYLVPIFALGLQ